MPLQARKQAPRKHDLPENRSLRLSVRDFRFLGHFHSVLRILKSASQGSARSDEPGGPSITHGPRSVHAWTRASEAAETTACIDAAAASVDISVITSLNTPPSLSWISHHRPHMYRHTARCTFSPPLNCTFSYIHFWSSPLPARTYLPRKGDPRAESNTVNPAHREKYCRHTLGPFMQLRLRNMNNQRCRVCRIICRRNHLAPPE